MGVFIGQHVFWNRKPINGYAVVFVPFSGKTPSGVPVDVLRFLELDGVAHRRPVGVAWTKQVDS